MWKYVRVLAASVAVCSATGLDVKADSGNPQIDKHPGDEVGVTRYAQFVQERRAADTSRIFYNIVTDGGAQCSGLQEVTKVVSISSGTNSLTVTTNTFTSSDVGKYINIQGAGNAAFGTNAPLLTRITGVGTFSGTQTITLAAKAQTSLSSATKLIRYGFDDAWAFRDFNKWARANQGNPANQVVLTVPNGALCWFATAGSFIPGTTLQNAWAAGIKNLIVEGAGATISSLGGVGFSLGGQGIVQVGLTSRMGQSARIATVSAGASEIALTPTSFSAGYISRFPIGKWIMIGGLNTQALFVSAYGFPPNLNFFEWRQITAVNTGTGVIKLDRPLNNSYSSAWPEFNAGNGTFEVDAGGPATIYALNDSWSGTAEYRGLTISQEGQTYAGLRNVTYRNVTFTGGHGGIPTQNETWSAINTTFDDVNMETDKLVGTMLMDRVTIKQIVNQSTSTDRFMMRNSTVTGRLDGGAKYTEITDSTLNIFGPGTFAYGDTGTANQTICTRCNIGTLNYSMGYSNSENPPFWTKSGGVITMPLAAAQGPGPGQRFFVPGARVFYTVGGTNPPINFACCETIGSFEAGAITSDTWPAPDNQTVSASVTSRSGFRAIEVSGSSFSASDVGKTIIIPGARVGGADLRTWITDVSGSGPQNLTVYHAAARDQNAVTQTLQWGTSNMHIQTNQPGGFPSVSAISKNSIGLKTAGSWNFTCDACTGDPNAVGSSIQAGAIPRAPLGSYITRTYSPSPVQGSLGTLPGRGLFRSLRVNVTAAASVGTSSMTMTMGQFNWFMIDKNAPLAPITFNWQPSNLSINLKVPGDRVITPRGVTCNGIAGGCSGDSIVLPTNLATMWLQQGAGGPFINTNAGGKGTAPTLTLTLKTDPLQ